MALKWEMSAAQEMQRLKRLVRRSNARAPVGLKRQRQQRLKTIRLLPTNMKPSPSAGVFRLKVRPEETADSGSTKCDYRRILVARAQRRRPEGVRAREQSARNSPPGATKVDVSH